MSDQGKLTIPSDIFFVYSVLNEMKAELSDVMLQEVTEWRHDIKESVEYWQKRNGPEPDWNSFRSWLNQICYDDGMPRLFASDEDQDG
jgi:hypothetical protein